MESNAFISIERDFIINFNGNIIHKIIKLNFEKIILIIIENMGNIAHLLIANFNLGKNKLKFRKIIILKR